MITSTNCTVCVCACVCVCVADGLSGQEVAFIPDTYFDWLLLVARKPEY